MKKTTFRNVLPAVFLVVLATGCQSIVDRTVNPADYDRGDYLISNTYAAADKLIDQLKKKFDPKDSFVVATFVNIESLEQSSPFGRISSEQVASRLAQHGLKILDVKLRKDDIFVKSSTTDGDPGEFLLSRNLREGIGLQHDISGVVVGMYTTTRYGKFTHVSIRVLQVEDGSILASHDYSLENREIQGLLRVASRY